MQDITLIPNPRKLRRTPGSVPFNPDLISRTTDPSLPSQAYRLTISPAGIGIASSDAAGAFYADQTLAQLRRQFPDSLPCVEIEDSPDFAVRGVMLDISRDKVPTIQTLLALVDFFAELKINQLQLYTEHTFAYRNHEEVWRDASPMTAHEIRQLDRYCAERFIELVPNQNSFGHLARWLKHPRYRDLAECPDGFTFPWGVFQDHGFTLNPLDPRSLALVEELYEELLPNYASHQFNVGCDETFDLGLGKSKAECEKRGKERVYLEFVLKIYEAVKRRGRTMQFWGDIILHKPELIRELPRDIIALNWGYEADHPFEKETAAFRDAGVPFYVCPGTSSWCSISGRTDNAIANLKAAAKSGLARGAIGYLNTDWGDVGHLQYLPISYPGFAAGAAYSWCLASNEDLDLAHALDLHVLHDRAGVMGGLLLDFGNTYKLTPSLGNGTRLFWSLIGGEDRKKLYDPLTRDHIDASQRALEQCLATIDRADMLRPDTQLIKDELRNAGAMLIHACRRGCWRLGAEPLPVPDLISDIRSIITEHERLWLARNRPGGLPDSARHLKNAIDAYEAGRIH